MTYKLTPKRKEKAKPTLEEYRNKLQTNRSFDCLLFEKSLRECLDEKSIGHLELKDLIIELSKDESFERTAAFYMQNHNASGPVEEFKPRLAELYGIDLYDSHEREEAQQKYWNNQ